MRGFCIEESDNRLMHLKFKQVNFSFHFFEKFSLTVRQACKNNVLSLISNYTWTIIFLIKYDSTALEVNIALKIEMQES
jgi:hypothetical protein